MLHLLFLVSVAKLDEKPKCTRNTCFTIECLVLVSGVLLHIDSLFFFLHTLKTVKNIKAIKVLAECAQKFLFGAQKRNETLENATLLDIFLDLHCIISTDQFYGFERVNTRESTRNRNINRMRC